MFRIRPELVFQSNAIQQAALGWFLPCVDGGEWLRAIRSYESDRSRPRTFVAASSIRDRSPSGLLFLADDFKTDSISESRLPDGLGGLVPLQPIRRQNVTLWIPINAEIWPSTSADRLIDQACDEHKIDLVWLPVQGLMRFEPSDEVSVSQIIQTPDARVHRSWQSPPPTTKLPERINDIRLLTPPQMGTLFQQERDSIGGNDSSLMDLNEDGSTQQRGIGKVTRGWLNRKMAKWLQSRRDAEKQHTGSHSPDHKSRNENVGDSVFSRFISKRLQAEREKQLEKLLDLMKTNPDKALQFALPLAAAGALFRGIGRAGSMLTPSSTDFSLGGLFGGGDAVDLWDLGSNLRNRLEASYQEQARREIAAGRYRRAAYIHAHLLGDYATAAAILEQGGYFGEAAVLYGEHLNRPADQARCLEACGQIGQAAEIYERLERYEDAALVWQQFGNEDRARAMYEKAVSEKIKQRQVLAAAEIIRDKLDEPHRAESLLWEQWPSGCQPLQCAQTAFSMCADSQRHDEAYQHFQRLSHQAFGTHDILLARLCADLSRSYPSSTLRHQAEDQCRLAAANGIADLHYQAVRERVDLIRSLDEQDDVLARDARRFPEKMASTGLKLAPRLAPAGRSILVRTSTFRLPRAEYRAAIIIQDELLSIGTLQTGTIFVRSTNLELDKVSSSKVTSEKQPSLHSDSLSIRANHPSPIQIEMCQDISSGMLARLTPNTPDKPDIEVWGVEGYRLKRHSKDGTVWALQSGSMTLASISRGNVSTYSLQETIREIVAEMIDRQFLDPDRIFLNVAGATPVITVDQIVLAGSLNGRFVEAAVLGSSAQFVASSMNHTSPRVLIGTESSLKVVWLNRDFHEDTLCRLGKYSAGCFLFGGRIAAITDGHLRLFEPTRDSMRMSSEAVLQFPDPLSVLRIGVDQIGVLYRNGVVDRYRIAKN